MLRASGFTVETRVPEDVYICRHGDVPYGQREQAAVYPARGAGAADGADRGGGQR